MTPAGFEALLRLIPGPAGATRRAARRVLVDGEVMYRAARAEGITPGAVGRLVERLRELEKTGCPVCHQPVLPQK